MSARLATSILVGALMRQAEGQGGFAAVLAKGDPTAGAVLVILTERALKTRMFERLLQADGSYRWQDIQRHDTENKGEMRESLERRRKRDPDLWILELDVPSLERFAAEMNSSN